MSRHFHNSNLTDIDWVLLMSAEAEDTSYRHRIDEGRRRGKGWTARWFGAK